MELLNISTNFSLKNYNTFGIEALTDFFVAIHSTEDLNELKTNIVFNKPKLILGGGSNILFTKKFEGLVLQNIITGISLINEDETSVYIKAGGGENWHQFVLYCIHNNYGGVENLSFIPGTVGAAPIQNIGAYGVELQSVFYSLEAFNMETGIIEIFTNKKCNFGYRNSIFKNDKKGMYFIISVTFKLMKHPVFNITYGAIQEILNKTGAPSISVKSISDAVIEIRKSKLPDPAIIGNAGSFFKNPEIEKHLYEQLKKVYPDIPGYAVTETAMKIPAGWLIEKCGWKGKRIGNTGMHKDQALVLVNYGNATGYEIYDLAMQVKKSVQDKFEIEIVPEVNII